MWWFGKNLSNMNVSTIGSHYNSTLMMQWKINQIINKPEKYPWCPKLPILHKPRWHDIQYKYLKLK